MIYVSRDRLSEIEYLIGQSIQGNHVLFDLDDVRRIFGNEDGFYAANRPRPANEDEEAYAVEPLIERLMARPSLAEKRAFLDGLDPAVYERVVRTYFNIVENNLYESVGTRH